MKPLPRLSITNTEKCKIPLLVKLTGIRMTVSYNRSRQRFRANFGLFMQKILLQAATSPATLAPAGTTAASCGKLTCLGRKRTKQETSRWWGHCKHTYCLSCLSGVLMKNVSRPVPVSLGVSGTLHSTPLIWLPVLSNIEPPAPRRKAGQAGGENCQTWQLTNPAWYT